MMLKQFEKLGFKIAKHMHLMPDENRVFNFFLYIFKYIIIKEIPIFFRYNHSKKILI